MNRRLDRVLVPASTPHFAPPMTGLGAGFFGAPNQELDDGQICPIGQDKYVPISMSTPPALTNEGHKSRLSEVISALGGYDRAGALVDKSGKQIRRYESGESEPPFDVVARLAAKAGRSLDWMAGRAGAISPVSDPELVFVPRFELMASAGHGRAITEPVIEAAERVAFSRAWLRRLNVEPQFAELLIAAGDSMYPTISDGDLMLVDRGIRSVETSGIYVVTVGGGVVVKRVFWRRDGSLVLKSDNSLYPEEVVPPEELHTVTIEGRVRWAARSM